MIVETKNYMSKFNKERKGEFDFDNLPEGVYSFSGQEGFVKVYVDKNGVHSWNLDNWFASLDPDHNKDQRTEIIEDIKKRLNVDTGIISLPTKSANKRFFKLFRNNPD